MNLTFRGTRFVGGGEDRDGAFSIVGEYDPGSEEVRMLKSYIGLRVWYTGIWNGRFVAGTSTIESWPLVDYGSFEAWPESEEMLLTHMEEQQTVKR